MVVAYKDFIRNKNTGVGENGLSVELIRQSNDAVLATTSTAGAGDQSGSYTFSEEDYDYNGPTRIEATDGDGNVHVHTSESVGQIGPWRATDFVRAMKIMRNGVAGGIEDELEVSANGSNMILSTAAGLGFMTGLVYWWPSARAITVPANISGSTRFDLVALLFYAQEHDEAGRVEYTLVEDIGGILVPGDDPAIPGAAYGADADTWYLPLATIEVGNGVTSIAANKVNDARVYSAGPLIDQSVTFAKIATGAIAESDADSTPESKVSRGDHFHTTELTRGVAINMSVQAGSDTVSTTSTSSTVPAMVSNVVLPGTGSSTWKIWALGFCGLKHSAGNLSHISIRIDADESTGRDVTCPSTSFRTATDDHVVGGFAGGQTVNVRVRFRSEDAGTTTATNPSCLIIAERTA